MRSSSKTRTQIRKPFWVKYKGRIQLVLVILVVISCLYVVLFMDKGDMVLDLSHFPML